MLLFLVEGFSFHKFHVIISFLVFTPHAVYRQPYPSGLEQGNVEALFVFAPVGEPHCPFLASRLSPSLPLRTKPRNSRPITVLLPPRVVLFRNRLAALPSESANNPRAQNYLGALYYEGRGVTRDVDEASAF